MAGTADFMRKYCSEEAWKKWRAEHEHWPSEEWLALLSDIQQSLAQDPESETAQALASRWLQLRDSESGGDTAVLIGLIKTWAERQHWPPAMYREIARFDVESIARFIDKATIAHKRKYYSEAAWAKLTDPAVAEERQSRVLEWCELWLAVAASLQEDPASEVVQALLARWMNLTDSTSAGDLDLQAGALKAWADHKNWPAPIQQALAPFKLETIHKFIVKAHDVHRKRYYREEAWSQQQDRATSQSRSETALAWNSLYREINAKLGEDPGSEAAQQLAQRWMELTETTTGGDPNVMADVMEAWQDRKNWPEWKQRRIVASNLEPISQFITRALEAPLEKYFSPEAWVKRSEWAKQQPSDYFKQVLKARADLFADVKAALDDGTAEEKLKVLVGRWRQLREAEAGHDLDMLEGKQRAWADRRNWPIALRLKEASSYGLSLQDFERASDFIDTALSR